VLELNDATMFNILSNPITAHLVVIAPAVCSYLTVVWLDWSRQSFAVLADWCKTLERHVRDGFVVPFQDLSQLRQDLGAVARQFRGKMLFVFVDSSLSDNTRQVVWFFDFVIDLEICFHDLSVSQFVMFSHLICSI
jgi:hypothetical protein